MQEPMRKKLIFQFFRIRPLPKRRSFSFQGKAMKWLINSAATVSKIASQNNEESAACLLKIELTFSHARYKVILETGCLRRRNIVPLEHGTEKYVKFPSFLSIPNYNDSIKYCVQARYWNAKRVLACIQPSPC